MLITDTRACGIYFVYFTNSKSFNIDPWETPQFIIPGSEKTVPNETKKALFVR